MEIKESDVRAAYANLRKLTKGSPPQNVNLSKIEKQTDIILRFKNQDVQDRQYGMLLKLPAHAEMALAEGHVDIFEKVCGWCKLDNVKDERELEPWTHAFINLYSSINFHCPHTVALAIRLANSKEYMKAEELHLRWKRDDTNGLSITVSNILNHLFAAPVALNSFRKLYAQLLDIYKSKNMYVMY